MLSPALQAWRDGGQTLSFFGHEIFYLTEGPADAPALLILHGFPTSSFDFVEALPVLSQKFRVVLHDHIGFGFSSKPQKFSYSLVEQAEVALAVWKELGITRGHLLAHDYGTSVCTELLARRERGLLPIELQSVTLSNGSVHIELAHLAVTQKALRVPWLGALFAKLSNKALFQRQLQRIFGRPDALNPQTLDLLWEALLHQDGHLQLPKLSHYHSERWRFWARWIGALTRLDIPTHILWGRKDPIAVAAIAEQLFSEIPNARLTWLDELGHYPMLEAPERYAQQVVRWIVEQAS